MRGRLLVSSIEESCRFCIRPDPDRIVVTTDNFYVMMSLGPLVEGYTLLVSRKHISCCAEIADANLQEFNAWEGIVKEAQNKAYGQSVVYEHGRTGSCLHLSEAHCYHAHLHMVPTGFSLAFSTAMSSPVRR